MLLVLLSSNATNRDKIKMTLSYEGMNFLDDKANFLNIVEGEKIF